MKHRYSLRFHIATAFTSLVLVVGCVIAWVSYNRGAQMLNESAAEVALRMTREAGAELDRVLAPARSAVRLLALQPVAQADNLEARMASIATFGEALRLSDAVVSYYIGYADGDFFMLRRLTDAQDAEFFGAPTNARYVVQSIERHRGTAPADARLLFLDEGLRQIPAAPRPQTADFDPRARPWYAAAIKMQGVARTDPYVFFTTGRIGTTLALRTPDGQAVVGADIRLETLAAVLARQRVTPGSRSVLLDEAGRVIASDEPAAQAAVPERNGQLRLAAVRDLAHAGLAQLASLSFGAPTPTGGAPRLESRTANGSDWNVAMVPLSAEDGRPTYLGLSIPADELLVQARVARNHALAATALLILLAVPLALGLARAIARPLSRLDEEAEAVRHFDFARPISVKSVIREVDDLALTLEQMKRTLARFLDITARVAAEEDFERLLPSLLEETAQAAGAHGGLLYLTGKEPGRLLPAAALRDGQQMAVSGLAEVAVETAPFGLATAVREAQPVAGRAGADELREVGLSTIGPDGDNLIAVPLFNRKHELVGALVLFSAEAADAARLSFIGALSGFAAVSLEARELIRAQKALFEAFIQLIAGAIDAKSPYTGGHCARVPVLARMLAEAACAASEGPYRDFQLGADQWEAVHVAAWLHDCGKVTTPEYVVDKSTKLETLYDRIHEIRTRFEVLKRDAEVACWRAITQGEDAGAAQQRLQEEWRALDEDFAFVASCNEGGEFISPEHLARLQRIAGRIWLRTLDDRIGISHEERQRKDATPAPALPVAEPLIADRPEHCIPRRQSERFGEGNPWGFRMPVPDLLYNRGELYSLSIGRGTLTAEERFKINEHIIQTIIMLGALPFPRHLAAVPELAGGHHEKMDGTGYPKGLRREQMSPVARMMAIADIFEALTAVDRPYKRGKTLSESLAIMARMRDERHIDAELFELFLRSGVYRRYAERFLQPQQVDDVEVEHYLATA